MAFSTGTSTNMAALVTALDSFMVANGWTQDQLNTGSGQAAWHRTATGVSLFLSVRWDTSSPNHLGIYQALGYTGGNQPGQHPDDSGNGAVGSTNAVLDDERHVNALGNGPYTYWFFEQDYYVHVVVESSADVFKHFGWGALDKTGDWTGGEYAYGHLKVANGAIATTDTMLLDGLFADVASAQESRAATLHLESLPNQVAGGKWGNVWGRDNGAENDNQTVPKAKVNVQGGFRGGPTASPFGRYSAGSASGGIPMYPIELYYQDVANSRVYYLGRMKDVRGVNIRLFAPRDVVNIGGSDWYVFPSQQKSVGSSATGTNNQGIAYRRDNG
jgi:hypothetical protein